MTLSQVKEKEEDSTESSSFLSRPIYFTSNMTKCIVGSLPAVKYNFHVPLPSVFFWPRAGEGFFVALADGETFVYEVTTMDYYAAASAPVGEIVGRTSFEALTMITCGGNFDSSKLEYDKRLVVRAKRAATTATSWSGVSH